MKSTTDSYDSVSRGAVKATDFVVTATPVANSHPACQETSGETEVINTGATQVKLFLIGNEAIVNGDNTDVNCSYDVVAAVPAGFDNGGSAKTNEVSGHTGPGHRRQPDCGRGHAGGLSGADRRR